MHRTTAIAALTLGSLALLAAAPGAAEAADGEALYAANCAKCHGDDGRGDTAVGKAMKVPSLVDPKWAAEGSGAALVSAFKENAKHKAVTSKVSDEELMAIAGYVRELAGAAE